MEWSGDMKPSELEVHHEEVEPGVVVITLSGKLMLGAEGEKVVDLVADYLKRGSRGIIFDITGLTRVDSTGIGRFIASYNRIEAAGGKMGIAAPTPHLRECFRATQLDRVFRLYGDLPAARAAMASAEIKGA
jgi:anti-anti-sigma factor